MALAIAAILATLASPMLTGFLARSQMNAVANDLTGALQLARMEAVSRNTCVLICRRAVSGAAQCEGRDGAWTSGWIVYENPACELSVAATDPPAGTTLRIREAVPPSITLNGVDGDAPSVIGFTPRGVTLGNSNGRMALNDARFADTSHTRYVVLARGGRVITRAPGDADD